MPLVESAIKIGRAIAREVQREKLDVVILASSDLTHYGPAYEFAPAGVGEIGLQWARENDRRPAGWVQRFEIENVVGEVRENLNACGGGAIAAMLSACRELGATRATLLRQTNSHETLQAAGVRERTSDNAVGYASVVVG